MDKPKCEHCDSDAHVEPGQLIINSGAIQVRWWCFDHWGPPTRAAGSYNLPHSALAGLGYVSVGDLQVIDDRRENPCEVCGELGTEWHHWAPGSLAYLFGDNWAQWPGAYLCRKHHAMWHDIVTPTMPGRHNPQLAEEAKHRWTQ